MTNKLESELTQWDLITSYNKSNTNKVSDFFGHDRLEELHWGKIFYHLFGEFFNTYRYDINFDERKVIDELIENYKIHPNHIIKVERAFKSKYSGKESVMPEYLLIPRKSLMIAIDTKEIVIYYGHNIPKETIMEIKAIADKHWIQKVSKKSFQMLVIKSGDYELAEFDLQDCSTDINLNYNDDFIEIDNIIRNSISEYCKKGLILLHGIPGTGKTFYIRHLIGTIRYKEFIYLPNYMIGSLNDPDFLPFIGKYPNSVLILEDCENAVMHRDNSQANKLAVSSLLNLGDGLLGDALSLQVICTFNTQLQKIDDALLRKGRLIARYEFKELETYKCQNLADKLGKDVIIDKPMTLAEIYNIESKNFENQKMKKVGFSVGV